MNTWHKEGSAVSGKYLNQFLFSGVVTLSRVKYGGLVQHTIKLHTPIEVYGAVRESIVVDESTDELEVV